MLNKVSLSKEEQMNCLSYSRPEQIAVYNTQKLKPQEELIFAQYFKNKPRLKILDVGCGEGRTSIHLHNLGHEVIAIDLVPEMIVAAKNKYPQIDFRVMNACVLDFNDQIFDVVLFSFNGLDCIYPEDKRWQAVAEIRRVLKKNGLYIMSSHNSIVWPNDKYKFFWWFINIFTGKIFTPFRLEYKGLKHGIKFIYFVRRPSRQIKDLSKRGFELVEVFTKKIGRQNWFFIDLFEEWPYFILKKK